MPRFLFCSYDKRYVFAEIERSTLSTQFRMSFTLKPDLNLDVYAEPAENSMGTRVGVGDMFNSITDQGTNVFLVKTSFWLPVR